MKVAIIGFDVEGKSSYEYFSGRGNEITICDQNSELETPTDTHKKLGQNYLEGLDEFDVIVRTAGLTPIKILDKNPAVTDKITSQLNEFLKACPTKNIIGITGTKGKGTTSSLIAQMLEGAGKTVHLGGNIGVPPLSFLEKIQPDHYVVLELSSFQLIDLKQPAPHIAVCLMVVPEHLDWHPDINDYTTAKSRLFEHQSTDDIAIYFGENELSRLIACHSPGQKIPYFISPGAYIDTDAIVIDGQVICHTSELKLLGKHNWQNICAAVTAVWQITKDKAAMARTLRSFKGLEHRLEFVRELDGVQYYNDSFGTTPETGIVAIEAFEEPKILIAGGSDKGVDYSALVQKIIDGNVKHVITIGNTGNKIADLLEDKKNERCVTYTVRSNPTSWTMEEIVQNARELADPGDVVLLSTGSASFDMFKDYKDRGTQFKQAVLALGQAAK